MRRAQASVEVAIATLLLIAVVAAAWVVASSSWIHAEATVARVAGTQAALRGHDPQVAELAAVPSFVRHAVRLELMRNPKEPNVAR